MAAADGKVWLTFSGTAACAVPSECVFAADATQADILAAYYRDQQCSVPPGAWLCVRPSPDAPDSARRKIMRDVATAAAIREYLALRYSEDAVLEPLLLSNPAAPLGDGIPAAAATDEAAQPRVASRTPEQPSAAAREPPAKRFRADGAPGFGGAAGQRAETPSPRAGRASAGMHGDDAVGPSAPPVRPESTAPKRSSPVAVPVAPAPVARPRAAPPADSAGGGAQASPAAHAAPAAPAALQLTLGRTKQVYDCWSEIAPLLRSGDVIAVVGTLPGPLVVTCDDLTLTGVSDAQRFTVSEGKLKPTLTLQGSRIIVRYANIHCPLLIRPGQLRSAVLVQKKCNECGLDRCDIIGAGERRLIKGKTSAGDRFEGNHGVDVLEETTDTRLTHVTIRGVTGTGVLVRTRSKAYLDHVLVTDVSGSGFWLRGSGKCVLQDCVARRCKVDGIFIDATRPCILLRCRAELCLNNGAVFDFPLSVLKRGSDAYADAVTLLLGNPHYTAGLVCTGNRVNGVVIEGGVPVDLTGAALRDNNLNGLLVTSDTLPGGTGRITITGADISGNGRADEAKAAEGETCGIALLKDERGVSRYAALVPQGPPFPGVHFSNNRGGQIVEVAD